MDLTVCVCVRDGAEHVDRCMGALVAEAGSGGFSILVVDHASRDQTPALLEAWHRRHPEVLRVVRFDGDGVGATREFAWRQTATEWVGFVDIDCELRSGWGHAVRDGIAAHAADDRCGAFGGSNYVPRDGSWVRRACALFLPTYVGGHGSLLNRPAEDARTVDHCPTLNVVYRRSALAAIGGFDAAYTGFTEDVDVSRRLRVAGYTLWSNPAMAIEHAQRSTLASWLRSMYRYGRGRCFYLKRHPEEFHVKFLAPAMVVATYLLAGAIDVFTGAPFWLPVVATAHGLGVAVLLLPEAYRQRSGASTWAAATVMVTLTHLAYGAGLLVEIPRSRRRFKL
jgi:glycosyltransferase involved in cell wall biosynthesis